MQLHKGAHVVLWFRCIYLWYNHFSDDFLRFGDFVLKRKSNFSFEKSILDLRIKKIHVLHIWFVFAHLV